MFELTNESQASSEATLQAQGTCRGSPRVLAEQ